MKYVAFLFYYINNYDDVVAVSDKLDLRTDVKFYTVPVTFTSLRTVNMGSSYTMAT